MSKPKRNPLSPDEIQWHFVRASGPGGQNVNKVSSAVELRFDLNASRSISETVKARLRRLAANRLNAEGILQIDAQRFRSQTRNREDALERLLALIEQASRPEKPRIRTRPTAASRERRLEGKRQRSQVKRSRARMKDEG